MTNTQSYIVLGIETSCDDTGVAIIEYNGSVAKVLAEALASQTDTHQPFGGVVPELASRDHLKHLIPLIDQAMQSAQLTPETIDIVAYTAGPGLMGALFVGACVARSLAFAWGCQFVPVHHMEAHLLIPMLDDPSIQPPYVALLVSGGHSQLYKVPAIGQYELVGETLDDAAGEAFDKLAKMLHMPQPGGPAVASLASQGEASFKLPRPMCDRPGYDLSFSGLKTAVKNLIQQLNDTGELKARQADVCASFQEAVVDCLNKKTQRVMRDSGYARLVVAGGVSANLRLRQLLQNTAVKNHWQVHYPRLSWCTDNGVMVAYAGLQQTLAHNSSDFHTHIPVGVKARWPLTQSRPMNQKV